VHSAGSITQTRILDLLQVLVLAILAACHLADGRRSINPLTFPTTIGKCFYQEVIKLATDAKVDFHALIGFFMTTNISKFTTDNRGRKTNSPPRYVGSDRYEVRESGEESSCNVARSMQTGAPHATRRLS